MGVAQPPQASEAKFVPPSATTDNAAVPNPMKDGRSKPRAYPRVVSRATHALPPVARTPRFPLVEVFHLGLNISESRRSIALIFALSGGRFEGM